MTLLAPLPQPVLLGVDGSDDLFPVRRVFCVGRNYADHVKEMGGTLEAAPPIFFTKWAEDVVPGGSVVPYPQSTSDFHFEGELVLAIGRGGREIARDAALEHVLGYAAGLDMTRRDLQKKSTGPWDTGKNFEAAAPVGAISLASRVGHPSAGAIRTIVNGDVRQDADLAEMIWPVPDIIAFLSGFYRLEPGDLIFTGTPAGVGPVVAGDKVRVEIDGLTPLEVTIG
jgi:fumarylpyruvate hydrolase